MRHLASVSILSPSTSLTVVRTGPRGSAPTVLIHPAGLDLTYWDAQVAALKDGYDVVAFDLPGHGRSPALVEGWTFNLLNRTLLALLVEVAGRQAHLVGFSVSGMIAQSFALAHPSRVASLSLIGTASEFPDAVRAGMRARTARSRAGGMAVVVKETMKRWFTPETIRQRPDLIDRASKTVLADDVETPARLWEAVSGLDLTTRLAEADLPTLILVGDADSSCQPSAARII